MHELLGINDELRDAIVRDATITELRRLGAEQGMVTLRLDGYRKVREGITTVDLAKLIPTWRRLGWKMLTHVTLQARFQSTPRPDAVRLARTATLPQAAYRNVLESLRDWIASLTPAAGPQSVWRDYSKSVHYSSDESAAKRALVSRFVGDAAPELLLDIGCNSGDYAAIALDAGAKHVVGLEADTGALDAAFCRAQRDRLMFLPLRADAADPSPAQGWRGLERPALETRCKPDKLLALAVIHHLALSRNIPLPDIVRWLVSLAPEGLVEFVPKSDGKVLEMLALREDIFADYDEARFRSELERHANIRSASRITESGRVLYWYKVKTSSEASHQMIGR